MIHNPREALEFVRRHRIVTMTGKSSFVEEVAGGPVKGSWWSHEKGGLIFRLAESLHDAPEVLVAKLVDGRVTFIDRALWPALARMVTDEAWRAKAAEGLGPDGRRLLRDVERRGRLRLDRTSRGVKSELEQSLLVHSGSVHTEKGSHATVLTSWSRVFNARTLALARNLTLKEAQSLLGLK